MQLLHGKHVRNNTLKLGLVVPALLLTACQVAVPRSAPPPNMMPDNSVSVAGVTASSNTSTLPASATYTVKRDTLRESLTLSGKVVPGRSAQLMFHASGTVTAVNVSTGQTVNKDDILAQVALDEESLKTAQAQATLAELNYQAEQDKLAQLQAPGNNDTVQQLRISIERDQADVQKLEQEQAVVQSTSDRDQKALASAQSAADRKVALAEAGLAAANDAVTKAQTDLKVAQEDAQAAKQQSSADAAAAASSASAAVRIAARQLDEASAKLEDAQGEPATAVATDQLETLQLRVEQDNEVLKDTQADARSTANQSPTLDHTAHQIAAEAAAAKANAKAAERALATDQLALKHLQGSLDGAKRKDASDLKAATYAVEAAKEQLAAAQLNEQQAQQKAQALANEAQSTTPTRAGQQTIDKAQGALAQTQANARTAELSLEDAQAAQQDAADTTAPPAQFADHALTAAKVQLSADQAKLAALQTANSATEIDRQHVKVNLLRDQALAAAAAAQPVASLTAPFDGTVAEVGLTPGQSLVNGTVPADGSGGDARLPAVRVVALGASSIMADATESDVAKLDPGQRLDLSFPGLPGESAQGTITDIGATATVKNNQTTYPVRIDMPSPPPNVKFGMSSQANLAVTQADDVLVAPRRAIRTFTGQTLVDKLDANGNVQTVPVQIGRTFGPNVELLGGVKEGDVIAIYDGVTAGANNAANR